MTAATPTKLPAQFDLIGSTEQHLVLRDTGSDQHRTILEDAHAVVEQVRERGAIGSRQTIKYHTRTGHLDELLVRDGWLVAVWCQPRTMEQQPRLFERVAS